MRGRHTDAARHGRSSICKALHRRYFAMQHATNPLERLNSAREGRITIMEMSTDATAIAPVPRRPAGKE